MRSVAGQLAPGVLGQCCEQLALDPLGAHGRVRSSVFWWNQYRPETSASGSSVVASHAWVT
ncbi:hypothetical protein AB0I82_33265 [Streptomyces sp. NPDC050315]|uniref:hypothetical protein n=1 Tax=Streptomyces sp. NPDC050315 TaxID=3155039 RepID=UPI00341991D7